MCWSVGWVGEERVGCHEVQVHPDRPRPQSTSCWSQSELFSALIGCWESGDCAATVTVHGTPVISGQSFSHLVGRSVRFSEVSLVCGVMWCLKCGVSSSLRQNRTWWNTSLTHSQWGKASPVQYSAVCEGGGREGLISWQSPPWQPQCQCGPQWNITR